MTGGGKLGHLEQLPYPLPLYGMAHVPKVLVIRDDSDALLSAPFTVGVLAAALREVGGDGDPDAKQRQHLQRKVEGVLAAAAALGYDGLVLGSWGCGAFGNSHALVAKAFSAALSRFGCAFAVVGFAAPRAVGRDAFCSELRAVGIKVVVEKPAGGEQVGGGGAGAPLAPQRWLSGVYGRGASQHEESVLVEWREKGLEAAEAVQRGAWGEAVALFERCAHLRPEWDKGRACLARAVEKRQQADRAGCGGGGGGAAEGLATAVDGGECEGCEAVGEVKQEEEEQQQLLLLLQEQQEEQLEKQGAGGVAAAGSPLAQSAVAAE